MEIVTTGFSSRKIEEGGYGRVGVVFALVKQDPTGPQLFLVRHKAQPEKAIAAGDWALPSETVQMAAGGRNETFARTFGECMEGEIGVKASELELESYPSKMFLDGVFDYTDRAVRPKRAWRV
ncbi:hypothetical protein HY214_00730 [Candidatus Roizmanbacteria bacterium]|nr:hypothetical protein [Candidatus Roizmanbacteria bacterium]